MDTTFREEQIRLQEFEEIFETADIEKLEDHFIFAVKTRQLDMADYVYDRLLQSRYNVHMDYYANPDENIIHHYHIDVPNINKMLSDSAVEACSYGSVNSLTYLISKGLKLHSVINHLIPVSIKSNNAALVEFLLDNGASIELAKQSYEQQLGNEMIGTIIKERETIELNNKLLNSLELKETLNVHKMKI